MKTKTLWLAALLMLCVTTVFANERIKGNGNIVTKTIPVDEFTTLRLAERIQGIKTGLSFFKNTKKDLPIFHYTQSSGSPSLEITMDENLFAYLEIDQKDGKLRIRGLEEDADLYPTQLIIHGKSETLNSVLISGTMNFVSDTPLDIETLNITLSGVGDIKIDELSCDALSVTVSGVGDIVLGGKVNTASYEVSGVGKIRAFDCVADNLKCEISGVGNIEVMGNKTIVASASGVGTIKYKGEASVSSSTSGIGRVSRAD